MAKVATGILTLRQGNSPDWTDELDTQMKNWTQAYVQWMETSNIALQEGWSTKCVVIPAVWNARVDISSATTARSTLTNWPRSILSSTNLTAQRT